MNNGADFQISKSEEYDKSQLCFVVTTHKFGEDNIHTIHIAESVAKRKCQRSNSCNNTSVVSLLIISVGTTAVIWHRVIARYYSVASFNVGSVSLVGVNRLRVVICMVTFVPFLFWFLVFAYDNKRKNWHFCTISHYYNQCSTCGKTKVFVWTEDPS